jgi:hypothetical protein
MNSARIAIAVGFAAAVAGLWATAGLPAAAAPEPEAQWQSIFNGKDLDGWTVKCEPADQARTFWKVDGGAILADSMDAGKHDYVWLLTNKEYGDFALKLKFQAYRDSPGNSGVQVRSRYDDETFWMNGPQIDINPPGPWRTGMIWDETREVRRWLYPKVEPGKWVEEKQVPAGLKFYFSDQQPDWNEMEITCTGTKIKAVLNGVVVTDYDGAGVLDDAAHRKRNVGMRGQIALQIHTGDKLRIRFKDINVKELGK